MYLGQIVKVKQTENRNVDRAAHHRQNVIRFTQQLLTAHLSPLWRWKYTHRGTRRALKHYVPEHLHECDKELLHLEVDGIMIENCADFAE